MYIVASSAFKSAQSVGGVVIQRMCEQELAEDGAVRNMVSYMMSRSIPQIASYYYEAAKWPQNNPKISHTLLSLTTSQPHNLAFDPYVIAQCVPVWHTI